MVVAVFIGVAQRISCSRGQGVRLSLTARNASGEVSSDGNTFGVFRCLVVVV